MNAHIESIGKAIQKGVESGNFDLQKLTSIAQYALDALGLDAVYAVTNASYKYQIDRLVSVASKNADIAVAEHLQLEKCLVEEALEQYSKTPISEKPARILLGNQLESHLHASVTYLGHYFGTVGFASKRKRTWTESDKEVLSIFGAAALLHLSLSRLASGSTRERQILEKAEAQDVLAALFVDFETGNCHTVKTFPALRSLFAEWCSFDEAINAIEPASVDPLYGAQMRKTLNIEKLRQTLTSHEPRVSMDVPYVIANKARWARCAVEAIDFDANGTCAHAIATARDVTEEVRKAALLANSYNAGAEHYTVITGINLDTKKYTVYADNRAPEGLQGEVEQYGDYEQVMHYLADLMADEGYAIPFLAQTSIENLKRHFDRTADKIQLDFPCSGNNVSYWVRLEIVPAQTYKAGNRQLVLYYSDITEMKEREREFEEAKRSLEQAREHVVEKELQLTIDPLTGAYNRLGYAKYIDSIKDSPEPIGYLMIDVDHFKETNDAYGHEAGDVALIKVVSMLKQTFREKDKVFRMGGDEFVMLLSGCKEDAWNSVCSKLELIHHKLRESTKLKSPITLSCGLVISKNGFSENIPTLADDALYITKRNGRAGLTQVGLDGKMLQSWIDQDAMTNTPHTYSDLGKWRYECPLDNSDEPQLFLDESARFILGIPDTLSPKECYEQWTRALPKKHLQMLFDMQGKTAAVGQAEATHVINHPTLGKVRIRTRAKYREVNGMREFSGHFVALGDENVILSHDDIQFIIEAMGTVCFRTYYIELETKTYTLIKGFNDMLDETRKGIESTLNHFIEEFVHPDYRKATYEFADLDTLQQRLQDRDHLDCEYLSLSQKGWCLSRWLPVKWDKDGKVTHVLLTNLSIDETKRAEIEQTKKLEESLKLQLRIGEMIAKTKLVQAGIVDKQTGDVRIWLDALFKDEGMKSSLTLSKGILSQYVHPDDRAAFDAQYELGHIVKAVEHQGQFSMTNRVVESDGAIRTTMTHFETLEADPTKMLMAVEEVPSTITWQAS